MNYPRIVIDPRTPPRSQESAEARLARVMKTLASRRARGKGEQAIKLRLQVQVLDPECDMGNGSTRPRYMGLRGMGFVVEVNGSAMVLEVFRSIREAVVQLGQREGLEDQEVRDL